MPATKLLPASAVNLQEFTFSDADGNPLDGGLVYIYKAGTDTPATTYSDSGGSTPNDFPVVLDSDGTAPIYVNCDLTYKMVLTDSQGNLQWTVDNIQLCCTTACVGGVPVIASLSPATVAAGSPGFTLTIYGANFNTNSAASWNGDVRSTTFINSGTLQIAITALDVLVAGEFDVVVNNPDPGCGDSEPFAFSVPPEGGMLRFASAGYLP